jgi:transcriptional regulator with XRE-family HTH domain
VKNKTPSPQLNSDVNVGRRLRELRAEHGISIRALAEQSGLNVNTLSFIENGKTSPSVSTLQQVAAALKLPINAFFETRTPPQKVVYQKSSDRLSAAFTHGALADLGAGFARSGMEPFVVTLDPHADSGDTPIVHTGLEFVYCLEGRIDYKVDGEVFILDPGDSLLFEAHLPHCWRNAKNSPSRSLLILCPSDERDHPDERHFTIET